MNQPCAPSRGCIIADIKGKKSTCPGKLLDESPRFDFRSLPSQYLRDVFVCDAPVHRSSSISNSSIMELNASTEASAAAPNSQRILVDVMLKLPLEV